MRGPYLGGVSMEPNVKKKSAHNIYYGIEQSTGLVKHISVVPNGLGCACNCAACGTALEARKGGIRKHHFSHVSNYDCMYADEVAVYKASAAIISDLTSFYLPPIFLSLNAQHEPELLKEAQYVTPDSVTFQCETKQYPPKLVVTTLGSKLRLLFEFGIYYSEEDLVTFIEAGRNQNYSVLLCHFPSIGDEEFFTPKHLSEIWTDSKLGRRWVRSALEDKKREWYLSLASTPKKWGSGYECPIHISRYRGKFSARRVDCAHCEYNLTQPPNCLCLALAGPKLPALANQIAKLRQKNEARIQQREQQQAKRQSYETHQSAPVSVLSPSSSSPSSDSISSAPSSESLAAEEKRIKASFDPLSTQVLWDKFDRRWVKCVYCGEIKRTQDMSSYGGPGTKCNLGICSSCRRQGRNKS